MRRLERHCLVVCENLFGTCHVFWDNPGQTHFWARRLGQVEWVDNQNAMEMTKAWLVWNREDTQSEEPLERETSVVHPQFPVVATTAVELPLNRI